MYRTETLLKRQIRVRYPAGRGRIVLRTELDWERDTEPVAVSDDGETSTFALEARKPFLYFKCVLKTGDSGGLWSVGANLLLTDDHRRRGGRVPALRLARDRVASRP